MTLPEARALARGMISQGARDAAIARATGMSRGWLVNLIAAEGLQRARDRNPPQGITASAEQQAEFIRRVIAEPDRDRAELGRIIGLGRPDVKLVIAAARRRGVEIPARPAGRPPGVKELRRRRARGAVDAAGK